MVEADKTNSARIIIDEDKTLRPLNCDLNPFTRGDGSALFANGSTCVVATMLGPVEVKQQNLKIDRAHIECTFRPKAGLPQVKDKILEAVIRDACEEAILTSMHPRTLFAVHLQELDDCGGLEACAANAACLSLLCGGVPLKYTFAAVHCILDKNEELVLDPDNSLTSEKKASFTFIFDSLEKKIVGLQLHGHVSMAQLNAAEQLCREASQHIFQFYRESIVSFNQKTLLKSTHANATVEAMET